MHKQQKTVSKPALFEGVGLHTGQDITMTVFPAEANHGIHFVRTDLEGNPVVRVDPFHVTETSRSTKLKEGKASIQTIEHLLAAFAYLGIDNAIIEINGSEIPILDGSAMPFIEKLQAIGVKNLGADRTIYDLQETIEFKDDEKGIHLIATPSDKFSVLCMIDYNSKVLGKQFAELNHMSEFPSIASSRTFCFFKELEFLATNGLIKGGSLDNALVIVDDPVTEQDLEHIATTLNKPKVKVSNEGFLNNTRSAEKDEPAKHKLLDIVGDLNLLNTQVNMRIIAKRPGHYANTELAKLIKKQLQKQIKEQSIPKFCVDAEPVLAIEDIKQLLPHRYPFLLVDKIVSMTDTQVVGIKNVTGNEGFFEGHFPNNPVFPGVLQVEALAQTGGILALSAQEDPHGWDTYFLKIENCKFKHMVFPGDTLLLKMELIKPIRRGICTMYGQAYVGSKLVCEGELVALIQKR